MACAHGVGLPAVMIIFGDTVQSLVTNTQEGNFTREQEDMFFSDLEDQLSLQAAYYCGMAGGVWLTTYLQASLSATESRMCKAKCFLLII